MFLTTLVEAASAQKLSLLNQDNEGRQDMQHQESWKTKYETGTAAYSRSHVQLLLLFLLFDEYLHNLSSATSDVHLNL